MADRVLGDGCRDEGCGDIAGRVDGQTLRIRGAGQVSAKAGEEGTGVGCRRQLHQGAGRITVACIGGVGGDGAWADGCYVDRITCLGKVCADRGVRVEGQRLRIGGAAQRSAETGQGEVGCRDRGDGELCAAGEYRAGWTDRDGARSCDAGRKRARGALDECGRDGRVGVEREGLGIGAARQGPAELAEAVARVRRGSYLDLRTAGVTAAGGGGPRAGSHDVNGERAGCGSEVGRY